jgi:hypothetical protein
MGAAAIKEKIYDKLGKEFKQALSDYVIAIRINDSDCEIELRDKLTQMYEQQLDRVMKLEFDND